MKRLLTTWQRYFYKEFVITALVILFGAYGLYIMVDMMSHLKSVAQKYMSWTTSFEYYTATFSKRLDILVPFSLLVAAIRTLFYFQQRGELVALLTSGISRKALLGPFLNIAMCATVLLYVNYQWLLPQALPRIIAIYESRFGQEAPTEPTAALHEVVLSDGSKLIYSNYDWNSQEFHNVFWIR
jgi:lipopolysaccharide export LptBFGC system permease protein LptF